MPASPVRIPAGAEPVLLAEEGPLRCWPSCHQPAQGTNEPALNSSELGLQVTHHVGESTLDTAQLTSTLCGVSCSYCW